MATVVCIASGPSLTDADVDAVRQWRDGDTQGFRRVAVVNLNFRKAPWADVLFAGDLPFWTAYGGEVERTFRGECWTCSRPIDGVNYIEAVDDYGISIRTDRIHRGGNSGYQLVNLVVNWGAAELILLGYDMTPGARGQLHHHAPHGGDLHNPTILNLRDWTQRFIDAGVELRDRGIRVINCSPRTAITCFERLPLVEALRLDRPKEVERFTDRPRRAALLVPDGLLPAEHAALRAGLDACGYQVGDANEAVDVSVVWGGRTKDPKGAHVIVAENGYIDGAGGPYVALGRGGHNGAGRPANRNGARLWRLGLNIKPWRKDGDHILICPSRGLQTGSEPQPDGWTEATIAALRKVTKRPIRVREHPGNWKSRARQVQASLESDLRNAWATVIWNSAAGVRSLIEGVPVIYCAKHWICGEAAGTALCDIEAPLMPERDPALACMAASQWTLPEIASGEAFRSLFGELTVLCVLRSGGKDYTPEYVRRLRDGVAKYLTIPHRFVCLSDVDVPCERIPLKHDWPGWWSKIEMFRPDVVTGPTLYLDLDTVIVDKLDDVLSIPYEFAMLNIRAKDTTVGNSGAMWMTRAFPHVYERFAEKPEYWIDYHVRKAHDRYMGDQAFISDCFEVIPKLHEALPEFFKSYKYDNCRDSIPKGCSVVCFGGHPRPHEAGGWVKTAWV